MKIGFEQEFFVMNSKTRELVIPVPKVFPFPDESGVLIEARGEPSLDVIEAIFSLKADMERLDMICSKNGYIMWDKPLMVVSRKERVSLSREFSKGISKFENLYGFTAHRNKLMEWTAGIHISFTKPTMISVGDEVRHYNSMWDFPTLFRKLDDVFADEIKETKRNPGFYELKQDGRVEYRSLPNNVSHMKIITVLTELLKGA